MRKGYLLILLIPITILILAFSGNNTEIIQGYIPKNGFVPDEETAVKIAETILIPIYGKSILKMKPFKVELVEDSTVWFVRGVSPPARGKGGVPCVYIRKEDCKILSVSHGK